MIYLVLLETPSIFQVEILHAISSQIQIVMGFIHVDLKAFLLIYSILNFFSSLLKNEKCSYQYFCMPHKLFDFLEIHFHEKYDMEIILHSNSIFQDFILFLIYFCLISVEYDLVTVFLVSYDCLPHFFSALSVILCIC